MILCTLPPLYLHIHLSAYVTLRFRAGKKWGSFNILCQVSPPGQRPKLQELGLGGFLCKFKSSANKGKLSKGKFTTSLITKEKYWNAAGPKRHTAHRHLMLRAHPSPCRYLELVIGTSDLLLLLLLLTLPGSGTGGPGQNLSFKFNVLA